MPKLLVMRVLNLLLIVGLVRAQLNYEGNPLTENTEFTAEESHLSERSSRQNDVSRSAQTERPQKLYPVYQKPVEAKSEIGQGNVRQQPVRVEKITRDRERETAGSSAKESARQYQRTNYDQQSPSVLQHSVVDPAEVALNTFLNSRTPEESHLSLDHYLRSKQLQPEQTVNSLQDQNGAIGPQLNVNHGAHHQVDPQTINLPSHRMQARPQQLPPPQIDFNQQQQQQQQQQQRQQYSISGNQQQLQPQYHTVQGQVTANANGIQIGPGPYGSLSNSQADFATLSGPYGPSSAFNNAPQNYGQGMGMGMSNFQQVPNIQSIPDPSPSRFATQRTRLMPIPMGGMHSRNDMASVAAWRQRMRRIRGQPSFSIQPRVGPPTIYKSPPVPFKFGKPPVEVIYTKPPGFHGGPPQYISNPPVAYEDASAWFPEADYPPPTKDVYYSQLYAQSYDPHYYNYIAKTGKIKPHLYGKLGKEPHPSDDGIWAELYRGFTKHGLKNMMNPSFLLGLTIPAITLMLTALVQKRSLSRSDSREFPQEEIIQEYLERLQRAVDQYGKLNSPRTEKDSNQS